MTRRPTLIELPDEAPRPDTAPHAPHSVLLEDAGPSPADAPPVEEPAARPPTRLEIAARLAARPGSRLTRFFLGTAAALVSFLAGIAALRFIDTMLARWPLLGWVALALLAAFTLATLLVAGRELLAWRRLARLDSIHRAAAGALATAEVAAARDVVARLDALYADRPELQWSRERLAEAARDAYGAEDLLRAAETTLLAPLDEAARREVEAAARAVAAATALVPLPFADMLAAMAMNLRMIRRLAEIYGGRAGTFGGWRLTRSVLAHLVATGAVAAGDDLIHTVAGGGALAKLSRRFGEGVVNGALTARVGIAAMEVCRPLPFLAQPRPRVTALLSRGLKGLFDKGE